MPLWFVMFTDFSWKIDAAYVSEKLLSMYKTHSVKIWKFTNVEMVTFKKRCQFIWDYFESNDCDYITININNTKKKWAKNID